MRAIDAGQLRPHMTPRTEQIDRFECFGGRCTVIVTGEDRAAAAAVRVARARLLDWHAQFSRFEAGSELSRLNADPRPVVPVSALMARLVGAAVDAASLTGGLVDPTLASEIERAGYSGHFEGDGVPLRDALALAPPRTPACSRTVGVGGFGWRDVAVDLAASTVSRPPGLRFDPGGIAKGLFADELAGELAAHAAVVIDCAGDVRLGGSGGIVRAVNVESPFDGSMIHVYELAAGGVATSGIGKRSWMLGGRPAHHLLDPGTGRPAFTGVVQATALAPTAAEAEARSKAALLNGPDGGGRWLSHGGVIVLDDGSHRVIG
jgi:FAD:protein FMN transferase